MTAANQPTAHPSLSALYRDHHGWLAGWLRRRLGSAHDAADLSHDTYERLMVSGRLPEAGQAHEGESAAALTKPVMAEVRHRAPAAAAGRKAG